MRARFRGSNVAVKRALPPNSGALRLRLASNSESIDESFVDALDGATCADKTADSAVPPPSTGPQQQSSERHRTPMTTLEQQIEALIPQIETRKPGRAPSTPFNISHDDAQAIASKYIIESGQGTSPESTSPGPLSSRYATIGLVIPGRRTSSLTPTPMGRAALSPGQQGGTHALAPVPLAPVPVLQPPNNSSPLSTALHAQSDRRISLDRADRRKSTEGRRSAEDHRHSSVTQNQTIATDVAMLSPGTMKAIVGLESMLKSQLFAPRKGTPSHDPNSRTSGTGSSWPSIFLRMPLINRLMHRHRRLRLENEFICEMRELVKLRCVHVCCVRHMYSAHHFCYKHYIC